MDVEHARGWNLILLTIIVSLGCVSTAAAGIRPATIFPSDRSSVIGPYVTFSWEYGGHTSNTTYILSIQPLATGRPAVTLNVDRPETRRMSYTFAPGDAGDVRWRVQAVGPVPGGGLAEGHWSAEAVFSLYPTVADRIRRTGKLLVATPPASYDPFVGLNTNGRFLDFEVRLLHWLLPRIGAQLGLPRAPRLEVTNVPWGKIWAYMQAGRADIAFRSMTRSEIREREYPNLRFTVGYTNNHQVFIQPGSGGQFPMALSGRIVGVESGTVNEEAARYLAPRYGFTVKSLDGDYGNIYAALRRGDIPFALVDSSLVHEHLGRTLFPLGGESDLDPALRAFYRQQLGLDHEEYSFLVYEGTSGTLREILDKILQSPEYRDFLKEAAGP
ncbi:MAG TPA: transporter substrate-binding domain-containing protein [Steroidobacteraceae bacterium]